MISARFSDNLKIGKVSVVPFGGNDPKGDKQPDSLEDANSTPTSKKPFTAIKCHAFYIRYFMLICVTCSLLQVYLQGSPSKHLSPSIHAVTLGEAVQTSNDWNESSEMTNYDRINPGTKTKHLVFFFVPIPVFIMCIHIVMYLTANPFLQLDPLSGCYRLIKHFRGIISGGVCKSCPW